MIFLRQPINSVIRQVLWRNKFNLLPKHPNWHGNYFFVLKRSLFRQFNFSKSKVKVWRLYARLFFLLFRKVVIILLKNIDRLLWKWLLLFWRIQMDWRDERIRFFYQRKRKRERKRGRLQKRKKLSPFSPIPEIMFPSFLLVF